MHKVYIRGVKGHGKQVMNRLEQLGGINKGNLISGEYYDYLYYINPENNTILGVPADSPIASLIMFSCEEIKLE